MVATITICTFIDLGENRMAKKKKRLSDSEIAGFCEQLAYIIKAGISLQEGLMLMSEDARNDVEAKITQGLLESVESGSSLAYALKLSEEFPKYMVNMVEIGENSGRLEEVLESLCTYYERNEAISRNIRSSVTYPVVMIAIMVAVILVIIIEVLPVFQEVFLQLGSEVSPFVQGIMNFGARVREYAWLIIGIIAAIIVIVLILRNTAAGRRGLSSISERLFRRMSATISSGRFASAMALMLSSGMDVDESLAMAAELMDSDAARKKIQQIKEKMNDGTGFAEAIVETGMFGGLYGKMITVGFKTGTLDGVMKKVAQHYEEEIDRKLSGIIAALEPTLVAILSVIVGMILLSVMLPLMGVMSAIG